MSSPHVIRLRDPWQLEPPDKTQLGVVCYCRAFHCPTNLGPGQRVDVVLEGLKTPAEVQLNGDRLAEFSRSESDRRFDISDRLRLRNFLRLVFLDPPPISTQPRPPRPLPDSKTLPDSDEAPLPRPDRQALPAAWITSVRLEIFEGPPYPRIDTNFPHGP